MGSGETAPSLVPVHRQLLGSLSHPLCCWLDTPYGFQENANILSAKTSEFFQTSFQQKLEIAAYRSHQQPEVERQLAYHQVRHCNYLFAGPGSPSYAQRHWSLSEFPSIFLEKLRQPGQVCIFASAAACAVGALCLPVYEIYKVGQEPHWLPGLNLLPALGFPALVLPHYNNTVGGNHDTRFCYLGERRLQLLEGQLEAGLWIWGIDEHTAVILDLDQGHFEVHGKGGLTLRQSGSSQFLDNGTVLPLERLQNPHHKISAAVSQPGAPTSAASSTQGLITELAEPLEARFESALTQADGLGAAQVLLDLEQLLHDWSGDSDVHHWGIVRSRLRSLISQLGQAAQRGLTDPRKSMAPLFDRLLGLRQEAREQRHFQVADGIRQHLVASGVDVQDTPSGVRWSLRGRD